MSNVEIPATDIIMEIKNVTKKFFLDNGKVLTACDNISLNIPRGKTFGIVGESGCGKTTLLKTVMNIDRPTEGEIIFNGRDITKLDGEELRQNYRRMQLVFQDPTAAFNPKMKVKNIITEPLINFDIIKKNEVDEKAKELLKQVELPEDFAERYPHNMSGGQRQRVAIARALSIQPEIIACDEATSALDVSVQDTIIKLLVKLQKEKGFTYIFICHDLALVSLFAHRIAVMYLGNVMEILDGKDMENAKHPYTKALLVSVFSIDKGKNKEVTVLEGDIPSPLNVPQGCPFQNRCKYKKEICAKDKPKLKEVANNHFAACHFVVDNDFQ